MSRLRLSAGDMSFLLEIVYILRRFYVACHQKVEKATRPLWIVFNLMWNNSAWNKDGCWCRGENTRHFGRDIDIDTDTDTSRIRSRLRQLWRHKQVISFVTAKS